jgi:ribosomal protein S18
MGKFFKTITVLSCLIIMTSFASHKFYVGMFQLEFVPQKKELQITTRLFIDDLKEALENKFHKKTFLAEENESKEDVILLQKYISEKFKIQINGQTKSYVFLSKEVENNVLICYFKIKDIQKINSLEIENSILTDLFLEQQNIIQFNDNGKKTSLLLTDETIKGMLK